MRLLLLFCLLFSTHLKGEEITDWISGFPRESPHIKTWPKGKKVAVCFVLSLESWGQTSGPSFRPEPMRRTTDFRDESFRQYAMQWGLFRIGRLFKEQKVPCSLALNALFPQNHPGLWLRFRSLVPEAPLIAQGMNATTDPFPAGQSIDIQKQYIHRTLNLIEKETGIRPKGWLTPTARPNADTFQAITAEEMTYSLDAMDSDVLSQLNTPAGPLFLIPFPTITADLGQFLERIQQPTDIEKLWVDYVCELAREARIYPDREATAVAIHIHPYIMGTPDAAASLRRVLDTFKKEPLIWLTDTDHLLTHITNS